MAFMLIQIVSINLFFSNNNQYQEKRISFLQDDLRKDGFSSDQVMSISNAIRDTNFMSYNNLSSLIMTIITTNIFCFIILLGFFKMNTQEEKELKN
ncbi:hypothetical protein BH20ACI1_BH20ACI1_19870 [soil metagenome]